MTDVAVVGGGVVGCASAYYLTEAGAKVTLLERDGIAGAASGAAAGILAPLAESHGPGPFLDLALSSLRMFPSLVADLRERAGLDPELMDTPVLRVAFHDEQKGALRERVRWQKRTGLALQWLSGEEARGLEPRLSHGVTAALLSHDERQVNPAMFTQALAEAARRGGARLRPSTSALGFKRRGDRVTALRAADGLVEADAFVLAAGPWTPALTRRLGMDLPIVPRRGQMLAYAAGSIGPRHILWSEQGYLVPKSGGHLYAGATVESVGFRPRTTRAGLSFLRSVARSIIPALRYAEVASAWAALRPGTADGRPIIGPLPGWRNVYAAGGHFRNGILLAPITGQIVAQLVGQGRTQLALEPFAPGRFA